MARTWDKVDECIKNIYGKLIEMHSRALFSKEPLGRVRMNVIALLREHDELFRLYLRKNEYFVPELLASGNSVAVQQETLVASPVNLMANS